MRIEVHRPLCLGGAPQRETRTVAHARLWFVVEVSGLGVRRSGHLQLIRDIDLEGAGWRPVDLASRPLSVAADDAITLPEWIVGDLTSWLASWRPDVWVAPALEMVSEPNEDESRFRARVLTALRPEVQRRMDVLGAGDPGRRELAASVPRIAHDLRRADEHELRVDVRHVWIGPLLVGEGTDL